MITIHVKQEPQPTTHPFLAVQEQVDGKRDKERPYGRRSKYLNNVAFSIHLIGG